MSAPDPIGVPTLLKRMGAVPTIAMRIALWREACLDRDADGVVDLVVGLFDRLDRGDPSARLAFHAVLLAGPLGSKDDAVAERARERDLPRVAFLFIALPEPPPVDPAALRTPPLDPNRVVTPGELISWARRPDRRMIERLLFVPEPRMLGRLLANPKLTEMDVLRIASRRPYPSECLREVFIHPRWGQRRAVQEALILNPHTPLRIACGLVELLDGTHARRIARQPALHPLARAAARRRAGLT